MSVMLSIIVFIAFKLVPPGVEEFQIAVPSGEAAGGSAAEPVMEFSRQPDGGWLISGVSRDQSLRYAFDGDSLTISLPPDGGAGEKSGGLTLKQADLFLDAETIDWAKAAEITTRDGARAFLSRPGEGVKVEMVADLADRAAAQTYYIRWKAGPPE